MGAKLAIVFFMLMVAMAGVGSWYYKQTQQKKKKYDAYPL